MNPAAYWQLIAWAMFVVAAASVVFTIAFFKKTQSVVARLVDEERTKQVLRDAATIAAFGNIIEKMAAVANEHGWEVDVPDEVMQAQRNVATKVAEIMQAQGLAAVEVVIEMQDPTTKENP